MSDYRNNQDRRYGPNNRNNAPQHNNVGNNIRQQEIQNNSQTEILYPYSKAIHNIIFNNYSGNFALWYNKFIPFILKRESNNDYKYKLCDKDGKTGDIHSYYINQYKSCNNKINAYLQQKHKSQVDFMLSYSTYYDLIEITAKNKTPLITGIGQTHPTEVGIALDYNLGIPYIPASTIKGLLRFTTIVDYLQNKAQNDDKFEDTTIPEIKYYFGGQDNSGSIIILDAYPAFVPELEIDIMNPHYSKYYQGDKPPADYLEPIPIKFLVVKKDTEFIFRILVYKNNRGTELKNIKDILTKTLTEEGIGAKKSLGYGLFNPCTIKFSDLSNKINERQQQTLSQKQNSILNAMNEVDNICLKLSKLSNNTEDFNISVEIYKSINNYEYNDQIKIAQSLKEYYIRINKWEKVKDKQAMKVNNIKRILGIQ